MAADSGEVTLLLKAMKSGDATAADKLLSGLPMAEVAAVLDISPRSAERDWTAARVWLSERIR